ncbi:MAG TPA: class I SAM-dependent methyltransferase [Gemmatimonadota bacterium]|nr:class I SAM-dependent methyltransferase [Gemmatimonadota bacterium]
MDESAGRRSGRDEGFWNRPEQVERMAGREPDERLAGLVERLGDPGETRVLDLGCAAGRNTAFLARRGFDVHALDAAPAMVERTRERVAEAVGRLEAARRVREGRMDDLGAWPDGAFDLVIALGILHNAASGEEWDRALGEVVRVLRPGGRLLVANFAPGTDLAGRGAAPVPGREHVYDMADVGRLTLLDADGLDREMAARGLRPETPSGTVEIEMDTGRRVVVNALYRKAD